MEGLNALPGMLTILLSFRERNSQPVFLSNFVFLFTGLFLGTFWISEVLCSTFNGRDKNYTSISRHIPVDSTRVDLSFNQIQIIPTRAFNYLDQCFILELGHNAITDIKGHAFAGLEDLEELHLEHNRLTVLTKLTFSGTKFLKELWLSNNRIHKIVKAFAGMKFLRVLKLHGNRLKTLTADMLSDYIIDPPYVLDDVGELRRRKNPTLGLSLSNWESKTDLRWDCESLCWMEAEIEAERIGFLYGYWPKCDNENEKFEDSCGSCKLFFYS